MINKIVPLRSFVPAFKKFNKKFPSFKNEFQKLQDELLENPKLGESLGSNLYKVRLANKDKVKGKSAGFRIITYSVEETETECFIYLVKIYDKSEESTVSKTDLLKIIKQIFGK